MEKYVPVEKLSKKKRRELYAGRRGTWGALNPVTRKPAKPNAYNRKKTRAKVADLDGVSFLFAKYAAGSKTTPSGYSLFAAARGIIASVGIEDLIATHSFGVFKPMRRGFGRRGLCG